MTLLLTEAVALCDGDCVVLGETVEDIDCDGDWVSLGVNELVREGVSVSLGDCVGVAEVDRVMLGEPDTLGVNEDDGVPLRDGDMVTDGDWVSVAVLLGVGAHAVFLPLTDTPP